MTQPNRNGRDIVEFELDSNKLVTIDADRTPSQVNL